MNGTQFAKALAERLAEVLPDGFSITAAGSYLGLSCPDGFDSSSWAGQVDDDPTDFALYPEAAWVVLSSVQDGISVTLREPWPCLASDQSRELALPGAKVVGDSLVMWYGTEEAPAIRLRPISLVD